MQYALKKFIIEVVFTCSEEQHKKTECLVQLLDFYDKLTYSFSLFIGHVGRTVLALAFRPVPLCTLVPNMFIFIKGSIHPYIHLSTCQSMNINRFPIQTCTEI